MAKGFFSSFGSLEIIQVEPGTEIEVLGQRLVVTDGECVKHGNRLYATPTTYQALRAKFEEGSL